MEDQTPTLEQTIAAKEGEAQIQQANKTVSEAGGFLTLAQLERMYILNALKVTNGNKTQASKILGITIKTLYNKLHEYGEFENYATRAKPATNGQ